MKTPDYFLTLLVGGLLALGTVSCSDDDQGSATPGVKKPGANDSVTPMFEENLAAMKQTFTIDATTGGEVHGEQGTTIRIYANSLVKKNGDAVTGNVTLELIEIYKKSDMLLTKLATRGRTADGTIATLVSGGEFFVNAMQNGDTVRMNGIYQILAPTDNTGDPDQDMRPFKGVQECDNDGCDVIWQQQDRDIKIDKAENGQGGTQSAYYVFQSQFGWTNIDRWYSDPRDKTTLYVDVPEGYNNTNCAVYLSYDGEPTALALFDVYDATTGLFTEHYGQIPIGLQVHFIMVSVIDGQWYYSVKGATIGANHTETFTELEPVSQEDLAQIIDDLP
jgi:hypothetical protein